MFMFSVQSRVVGYHCKMQLVIVDYRVIIYQQQLLVFCMHAGIGSM